MLNAYQQFKKVFKHRHRVEWKKKRRQTSQKSVELVYVSEFEEEPFLVYCFFFVLLCVTKPLKSTNWPKVKIFIEKQKQKLRIFINKHGYLIGSSAKKCVYVCVSKSIAFNCIKIVI